MASILEEAPSADLIAEETPQAKGVAKIDPNRPTPPQTPEQLDAAFEDTRRHIIGERQLLASRTAVYTAAHDILENQAQ